MLRRLFDAISWRNSDPELIDSLRSSWIENNSALFFHLMQKNIRPVGARIIIERFDLLSSDAILRLLFAPSFAYALRARDYDALSGSVLAELALSAEGPVGTDTEVWTALGDFWLGKRVPLYVHEELLERRSNSFRAPHMACGLPIDLSVSTAATVPSTGLRDPQHLLPEELREAILKLDRSARLLGRVSPNALELFSALVKNIVLRSSPSDRLRLRSGSSAAAPGRVVLVNCDSDREDPGMVAESLLHEAIHIAISCTEWSAPLIPAEIQASSRATIGSPWTGVQLHVHAFVHACFVWFALYRFWELYGRIQSPDDSVRDRMIYIRRGFQSTDYKAAVDNIMPLLSDNARSIIPVIPMMLEEVAT